MLLRVTFLAALIALLAGCGGSGSPTTTAGTTTAAGETMALKVYYLRGNALAPVTVRVPKTEAVATAALDALLEGTPPAGYRTAIPDGVTLQSLAVANGVASLTFSGAPLSHSADGQVNFTLTQFPTVTSVDGRTRDDFTDLTPQAVIFVASPIRDSTVSSPVEASGTADVFEATLYVEVWSGGKKLRSQLITASAGTGTRGTWSARIRLPAGPAKLVFYEPSAENGAPLHPTEVDLTIR